MFRFLSYGIVSFRSEYIISIHEIAGNFNRKIHDLIDLLYDCTGLQDADGKIADSVQSAGSDIQVSPKSG